jgi:L-2-hydroxyglutarate oxidase LhgO
MPKQTADFLIIGGGVIGINLALCAKRTFPDAHVVLVDKETDCGLHASGRNSGVLHAGFYYTADSLKSRFTRDGNRIMVEYCKERGLLLNQCGKLVVAKNSTDLEQMDELLRRARTNGVELHELDEEAARAIEPGVRTVGKCLFSPATATVSPRQVMAAFVEDARNAGVEIRLASAYRGHQGQQVRVGDDTISAGYVINAAGLYADRIAQDYGFSQQYRIIPFKGLYLYANPGAVGVRTHIYPVPDLANPFLGVHFTVSAEGRTKLGPTAIPAFWREHYRGFANFDLRELVEIAMRELVLFATNSFGFRSLALQEITKYSRKNLVRLAAELVPGIGVSQFDHWGPAGIRAQLIDMKQKKLVMDFCYEGDDRSFHVLNAVSPAFTCAIPFTTYLFDEIQTLLH